MVRSPIHAMRTILGSGDIIPRINFDTTCRWVVQTRGWCQEKPLKS